MRLKPYDSNAKAIVKKTKNGDVQLPTTKLATVARAEKAVNNEQKMLMKKKGDDGIGGSLREFYPTR